MTTIRWGYERADCRGDFALSLFLDDMERVIKHYATQDTDPEACLAQAQAATDKLLQAYQQNAKGTNAFTGQSIKIRSFVDESGRLAFVPIFSAGLKQHLVDLLNRSNHTSIH